MSLFQGLALAVLAALAAADLLAFVRGSLRRGAVLFRWAVWAAAGTTILFPHYVQYVAEVLGIGRGADVLLYSFVLLFLAVSFSLYARQVRLQRQVTQMVRHVAIHEARHGAVDGSN